MTSDNAELPVEPTPIKLRNGFTVDMAGNEHPAYGLYFRESDYDKLLAYALAQKQDAERLTVALEQLLERYVDLVNCGDCGNWNPETEPVVINARAALASERK